MLNQNVNQDLTNNSGQGKNSPVLSVVSDKFNWGAFFLNWIWGIYHKSYLTLIMIPASFIPYIGSMITLGLSIWFGVEGNKWAWQNRRWESIEQFHAVQKKWAIAGIVVSLIIVPILVMGIVAAMVAPALLTNTQEQQFETMKKKGLVNLINVSEMNTAMGETCDYTSEGLANYYVKRLNVSSQDANKLYLMDGSVWEFLGDGACAYDGDCLVLIDGNGEKGPNLEGQDITNVSLYLKDNKYPYPTDSSVE